MRQLIKRFGIKTTPYGRIIRTGRVVTPSFKRPLRKERVLRPRLKTRFGR
jgi:hypothetical protein